MQTKSYNTYKITHKNGSVERINAENLVEALQNMEISEEYSPVLQTYMEEENLRTLVADIPAEVPFTSVVNEEGGGSIATPLSGTVHVGDQLAFKAIPARNYVFVNWKLNDKVISEEASFVLTMPELNGEASAVFKATFAKAPVNWATTVSPAEATGDGAVTFPASGTTPADGTVSAIAVDSENYGFDHWERNGLNVGDNKILSAEAVEPAEGETSVIYTAVFTAK
jgi:hypothetical protein